MIRSGLTNSGKAWYLSNQILVMELMNMVAKTGTGRKNAGAAADVLGKLSALVPTKAKPKAGQVEKPVMVLTAEAEVDAQRWVAAKTVVDYAEKRVENSKSDFCEYATRYMAEKLFANKNKTSNPLIILKKADGKTVDHQFQYTMTDKFKYRFPEVPEGIDPRDHFISVFTDIGLHPSEAEKLVDNELDFNPITGTKTLTELMEGSYGGGREWIESTEEEKIAGNKYAALLMWSAGEEVPEPLTMEEKALVIERSPGMQVRAGFYGRVSSYCQNVDQLMGVFKFIQPIAFPVYAKFAMNDTMTEKTKRVIEAAADILGTMAVSADEND